MISPRQDEPSSQQHYSKRVTGNENVSQNRGNPDFLYAKTILYFAFVKKIKKKKLSSGIFLSNCNSSVINNLSSTTYIFLILGIRLENLMTFFKLKKKILGHRISFLSYFGKLSFKGSFRSVVSLPWQRSGIANTLKNNSFIEMTKHSSSDRDNSVVILFDMQSLALLRTPHVRL